MNPTTILSCAHATCCALAVAALSSVVVAGDHHYEKIALSGDAAPGVESGVVFAAFSNPLNFSMMAPAIDELGNVALTARVSGPTVDETNRNGIWIHREGALQLAVRSGQPAPGLGAGVTFNGFPSDYIPDTPKIAGGKVAFTAELREGGLIQTGFGSFKESAPDNLALVASEHVPAPGTNAVFRSPFITHLAADGTVYVSSNLSGGDTTTETNTGIWIDDGSGLNMLLREGDDAPDIAGEALIGSGGIGTGGVAIKRIQGSGNSLLVQANLSGSDVDSSNDETLLLYHDDQWSLVVREGDDAPGFPNNTHFGGGSGVAGFFNSRLNDSGAVAFNVRVFGQHVPTTSTDWTTRTGTLEQIDLLGEPAPGTNDVFTMLSTPHLNNNGAIAFTGRLTDDDGDFYTTPPGGIWSDFNGELQPVVKSGDAVPSRPGWTVNNTVTLLGFNDVGEVLVSASLIDDIGGFRSAVLLADRDGDLVVVAATGDEFTLPGTTDAHTVQNIAPTKLSEDGETAIRLDFADNSSGVFAFRRGPAPCLADLSGDGNVGVTDLLAVLAAWGSPDGDVTGDGTTDVADVLSLLASWGSCGP